jgi:hypothetical protein
MTGKMNPMIGLIVLPTIVIALPTSGISAAKKQLAKTNINV